MGDKRTDPGHYYPGGRVKAKSGTAPQELIVQWSDVQGKPQIAPLPDRYRDSDVKGKINEIASKFATVVVAALIGWTACADITVQKKRKDQIYNDEQVVVDVSGDGVGMKTNTVIDIANATIATNPVVVAKLDGPTHAPTNTTEAAGKAADAMLTGIALTNRYTKAETDAKLAGKLDDEDEDSEASVGWNNGYLYVAGGGIATDGGIFSASGDLTVRGNVTTGNGDSLNSKANRPTIGFVYDNLALLDENGDLADSGIAKDDVVRKEGYWFDIYEGPFDLNFGSGGKFLLGSANDGYEGWGHWLIAGSGAKWHYIRKTDEDPDEHEIATFGDLPVVSATDPTFSNEVLKVQMLSLSTNITAEVYIAATNACANLGIDPALIPGAGTTGTVGGFIAMLFVVVFWMRKKIFDNSGKVNDTFAGELLGKPVAISAMKYGLASTSSTVKAADRTVTKVTLGTTAVTVTFPDADTAGKTRDFLLRIDAATLATGGSLTITKPTGATIYGDAFPSPATGKQYLVAITETAANEFYVRTIEITIPTEA